MSTVGQLILKRPTMADLLPAALERVPLLVAVSAEIERLGLVETVKQAHGIDWPAMTAEWCGLVTQLSATYAVAPRAVRKRLARRPESAQRAAVMLENLKAMDGYLARFEHMVVRLGLKMPEPLKW